MQPTKRPDWWTDNLEVTDSGVVVYDLRAPLARFLVEAGSIHSIMCSVPLLVSNECLNGSAESVKHRCLKAVDIGAWRMTDEQAQIFAFTLICLEKKYSVGIFDKRFIGALMWHVETV